eukprot:CAMPEP_0175685842 /NCGR_PEP_ID=MMETSP0097-20121207/27567_1 /TAXON_ID=311494 /ORGANISM="Alexandrium monilatum, Strain CCMP3105" /LENGTH=241 /DNA_ID=CAMNT_0016992827 /DNA_START=37 /DNA_END=760 /DNA_ORIENTATION=+
MQGGARAVPADEFARGGSAPLSNADAPRGWRLLRGQRPGAPPHWAQRPGVLSTGLNVIPRGQLAPGVPTAGAQADAGAGAAVPRGDELKPNPLGDRALMLGEAGTVSVSSRARSVRHRAHVGRLALGRRGELRPVGAYAGGEVVAPGPGAEENAGLEARPAFIRGEEAKPNFCEEPPACATTGEYWPGPGMVLDLSLSLVEVPNGSWGWGSASSGGCRMNQALARLPGARQGAGPASSTSA